MYCTAQVFLNGELVGKLHRDGGVVLNISAGGFDRVSRSHSTLDIVVMAMGRSNFGCEWDFKGLQSCDVTLNGALQTMTPLTTS